jgi:uncharacterized protein (TIGR03437 family)
VNNVQVRAGQPGIFSYAGPNNKLYGAVIDAATGQYITPSNPARTGRRYIVVVTGLGLTTPAITTNSSGILGQSQTVNLPVIVGVGNQGVPVEKAEYLPGYVGVYIVTFTIPQNFAPLGNDLPLTVAAVVSGETVFHNPANPVALPALVQGP